MEKHYIPQYLWDITYLKIDHFNPDLLTREKEIIDDIRKIKHDDPKYKNYLEEGYLIFIDGEEYMLDRMHNTYSLVRQKYDDY